MTSDLAVLSKEERIWVNPEVIEKIKEIKRLQQEERLSITEIKRKLT